MIAEQYNFLQTENPQVPCQFNEDSVSPVVLFSERVPVLLSPVSRLCSSALPFVRLKLRVVL